MRSEDAAQLTAFLKEFQGETDRGAALVGGAMLDDRLLQILKLHLVPGKDANDLLEGGSAPLGTFSAMIRVCYSLGLITKVERDDCDSIRRVRNEFAHRLSGLTFEDAKVRSLCLSLKAEHPGRLTEPRVHFINATVLLAVCLWYRGEHAKHVAAVTRTWPGHLRTKKEKPPSR